MPIYELRCQTGHRSGARRDLESRNPELAGHQRPVLAHEGRFEGWPLRAGDPPPAHDQQPAAPPPARTPPGEGSGS